MKQIGILFQPEMVRANIAGRKCQTRRLRKLEAVNADPDRWHLWQPRVSEETGEWAFSTNAQQGEKGEIVRIKCPYGKVGDMMWQRETHAIVPRTAYAHSDGVIQTLNPDCNHDAAIYRVGWTMSGHISWKPSIHMPRWAARFARPITRIRCERLQSITEDDAIAEGIDAEAFDQTVGYKDYSDPDNWFVDWAEDYGLAALKSYRTLWDSINAERGYGWERNPWVWVVEYAKQEEVVKA